MVPAPSALRIAFFGIQAATSRERAIVVGRPRVVVDLRLDRRRILGRLLGQRLRATA